MYDTEAIDIEAETKRISNRLKQEKLSSDEFNVRLQEELDKAQKVNLTTVKLDWLDEL